MVKLFPVPLLGLVIDRLRELYRLPAKAARVPILSPNPHLHERGPERLPPPRVLDRDGGADVHRRDEDNPGDDAAGRATLTLGSDQSQG